MSTDRDPLVDGAVELAETAIELGEEIAETIVEESAHLAKDVVDTVGDIVDGALSFFSW